MYWTPMICSTTRPRRRNAMAATGWGSLSSDQCVGGNHRPESITALATRQVEMPQFFAERLGGLIPFAWLIQQPWPRPACRSKPPAPLFAIRPAISWLLIRARGNYFVVGVTGR